SAAASAAASGTAIASGRRQPRRRRDGAGCAVIVRTRSRSSGGATGRIARSVRSRSGCDMELLLELLQRARKARRAVGGRDAEDACGCRRVELEDDAQRDHLALAGGEHAQRGLELRRQSFGERLVVPLRKRGSLLAAQPSPLRAEVVERDRACELAQPRTW